MKKVYYELKKTANPVFILAFVAVLLIFNCINIFKTYAPRPGAPDDKNILRGVVGIYGLLEGELTQEKYDNFYNKYEEAAKAVDEGNLNSTPDFDKYFSGYAFADYYTYTDTANELERQLSYNASMNELIEETAKNAEMFKDVNEYNYKQNMLIIEKYGERYINSFYYTPPIINLFTYSFSSVLILLCLMFLIVPMFSGERENDMLSILKSTRRGYLRRGICLEKIGTLAFYVFILVVLFGLSDIICLKLSLHFSGMLQPLYVIEEFQNTPVTISIISFWLVTLLLKWLGFVCIGLVLLLISKFTSNTFIGYILSLLVIAGFMILRVVGTSGALETLNLFNPVSLLISYKKFFYYETFRLGNTPVLKIWIQIIGGIVFTVALGSTVYFTPLKTEFKKKGVKASEIILSGTKKALHKT